MKRWEYSHVPADTRSLADVLDERGKSGWELVSAFKDGAEYEMIFKNNDRVYHPTFGNGIVIIVMPTGSFPVRVVFNNSGDKVFSFIQEYVNYSENKD